VKKKKIKLSKQKRHKTTPHLKKITVSFTKTKAYLILMHKIKLTLCFKIPTKNKKGQNPPISYLQVESSVQEETYRLSFLPTYRGNK